jgi:ribosomal protein S4E
VRSGLADSASDAQRKIKQKSVKIDGAVVESHILPIALPAVLTIRVGRQVKQVALR